jgi:hypothetical protein
MTLRNLQLLAATVTKARSTGQSAHGFSPRPMRSTISA